MTPASASLDFSTVRAELWRHAATLETASSSDERRAALEAMGDVLGIACREGSAYETFPPGLIDLRTTIDSHLLAITSIEASAGSPQSVERLIERGAVAVTRALPAILVA